MELTREFLRTECAINFVAENYPYKSEQTKQILEHIIKSYETEPEFLWSDKINDTTFIVRNPFNRKWYGVVMVVIVEKFDKHYDRLNSYLSIR